MSSDKDWAKQHIFKVLTEWAEDKFPGFHLANFLDLNIDNAKLLSEKSGIPLSWGMYVAISQNTKMDFNTNQPIENGNNQKTITG